MPPATLHLDRARAVQTMLRDNRSLEEVEEYVGGLELDDDARAALWLLAWGEIDAGTSGRRFAPDADEAAAPVLGD